MEQESLLTVITDIDGWEEHPIKFKKYINQYENFSQFIEETNWFLDDFNLKEDEEPLTKDEVYSTIAEGHLIDDSKPWAQKMLKNLVYESELLFRVPNMRFIGLPARKHSNLYDKKCKLPEKIKERYEIE